MTIQANSIVSIHYTLKNDAGDVLDSSEGGHPLSYLHGAGNIIKGLEAALLGKTVGAALDVTVEAEEAYGPHHEELVQQVPRTAFEGVDDLQVGMHFQADTPQGPIPITVTEIADDVVTVDGNHELAGVRLHFSVKVEDVRDATEEELAHGHAHGPGHEH